MHPVNKILSVIGLRVSHTERSLNVSEDFMYQHHRQLNELKKNNRGFKVFEEFRYEVGNHPQFYDHYECEFAARNLAKRHPINILDIGSYRHFVIGLASSYKVTTLDIRKRDSSLENETVLTSDAKQLDIPSDSFDAVVSLCALEHFGLGRYEDDKRLHAGGGD